MKKTISTILAIIISTVFYTPTLANNTDEITEVLAIIKQRIPDTSKYEEFDSNVSINPNGKEYYFSWYTHKDKYESLSVTADADGTITQYHKYDEDYSTMSNTPSIKGLTYDEAHKRANNLIKELNPDISNSLVIEKESNALSPYSNTFSFKIQRYENNIPVYNNEGYLTVNKDATEIIDFNINYNKGIVFCEADNVITEDDAWDEFLKNAGFELIYTIDYDGEEENIRLVYKPNIEYNQYIDAKTGKIKDETNEININSTVGGVYEDFNMKEESTADKLLSSLSPEEIEEITEIEGLIPVDEIENSIRLNEHLDLNADTELLSAQLNKSRDNERIYTLIFTKTDEDNVVVQTAYARVNARTAELKEWRSYSPVKPENQNQDYDKETLKNKADEIIRNLYPQYFKENTGFILDDNEKGSYTASYTRFVNNIRFDNDRLYVSLNPENNKISYININYTNKQFPQPVNIISENDVKEALSEEINLELRYYLGKTHEKSNRFDIAALGYGNTSLYSCLTDAFDKKLLNPLSDNKQTIKYTDIDGHYAKEIITTLANYGIGFEDSQLRPDEMITLEDYISLLAATFMNHSGIVLKADNEVSSEYYMVERRGFFKDAENEPQKPVTREMAAVYMIRMLGIEEYANLPDIYKCSFLDVDKNIGPISILSAMKVFNGDENGLFNPYEHLTRAQALIVIYNYLLRG